jgi:hypothetical protein
MKTKRKLASTSAAGIVMATSVLALAQSASTIAAKTGYAPVNGLNIYYEIHGAKSIKAKVSAIFVDAAFKRLDISECVFMTALHLRFAQETHNVNLSWLGSLFVRFVDSSRNLCSTRKGRRGPHRKELSALRRLSRRKYQRNGLPVWGATV